MWFWVRDNDLKTNFGALNIFERILLGLWVFLPIIALENKSNTYLTLVALLSALGFSFEGLRMTLKIFVFLLFLTKPLLLKTAFMMPRLDFSIFKLLIVKLFLGALALLLVFSLFLRYWYPEIGEETKRLVESAQVLDWLWKGLEEEMQYRLVLYYLAIWCFGRGGGFCIAVLFFAFVHSYSDPYILQMLFVGAFYIFLMLWSGSLSLPLLVHIISNASLFLIYKLGFYLIN